MTLIIDKVSPPGENWIEGVAENGSRWRIINVPLVVLALTEVELTEADDCPRYETRPGDWTLLLGYDWH